MTKDQTQQIKGIAILFMIWGHLFGNSSYVLSAYHPLLIVGDLPLVTILSRATGPIAFYLFLSGYGLYYANMKEDRHRYSRIFRLLITYWIALLFVIIAGIVMKSDLCDLSIPVLFENVIGLNPSYIPEAWFMLPYIILALTAPWEFNQLKSVKSKNILLLSFFLVLCTSLLLSRYGSFYIYEHRLLYMIFCWFHFQFPFLLGMASARRGSPKALISSMVDRLSSSAKSILYKSRLLLFILLITARCLTTSSALHSVYVYLFVLLWVDMRLPEWMKGLLAELGNRSVGMWFVHTSIGLYLFADWLNLLHNPLLIFIVVSFISWLISVCVSFICNKIINAAKLIYYRYS